MIEARERLAICLLALLASGAAAQPPAADKAGFAPDERTCKADATSRLQALMGATPPGGTMFLPAGCFLVSGAGPEIFGRTTALHVKGEAFGTLIMIGSETGPSTDLFHIAPIGPQNSYNWSFEGLRISNQVPGHGRHVFNIDTSGTGSLDAAGARDRFISGLRIADNYIDARTTGDAVHFTPHLPTGVGAFRFYLDRNVINGTVSLKGAGDSIYVTGNILTGASASFVIDQVPGAGNFVFTSNNFSMAGGLVMEGGTKPIIAWNEFEQQHPAIGPRGAMLDFDGGSTSINTGSIENNQLQSNPRMGPGGTNAPTFIRLDRAADITIARNRFGQCCASPPVPEISLTERSRGVNVTEDNVFVGNATVPHLAGPGTGTRRGGSEMLFAAVSDGPAVTNTASAAALRSYTIPPGRLQPGDVIRARATGTVSAPAGTSLNLRGEMAGKTLATMRTTLTQGGARHAWSFEFEGVVRAIGPRGVIAPSYSIGGLQPGNMSIPAPAEVVTTDMAAPVSVSVVVQWGGPGPASTIVCSTMTVELLHGGSMD